MTLDPEGGLDAKGRGADQSSRADRREPWEEPGEGRGLQPRGQNWAARVCAADFVQVGCAALLSGHITESRTSRGYPSHHPLQPRALLASLAHVRIPPVSASPSVSLMRKLAIGFSAHGIV